MAIDNARHNDGIEFVDHLCASRVDIRANGRDRRTLNQQVTFDEVARLRIHTDDGASFEKGSITIADAGLMLCRSELSTTSFRSGKTATTILRPILRTR